VAPRRPRRRQGEPDGEDHHDRSIGVVLPSARWVGNGDRSLEIHVASVHEDRAMVVVAWEANGRDLYDLAGARALQDLPECPRADVPYNKVKDLQWGAVVVGKTGMQVEIKREPRVPIGQLPLAQVLLREALKIGHGAHRAWVGFQLTPDHRGELQGVLGAALLMRVSNRSAAHDVSALGQSVIDRLIGLSCPEVDQATPGLDEGVKLFDLLGELVAHELGLGEGRHLHELRN